MDETETRVLVVDDHGFIRELLAKSLDSQEGLKTVGTAADGEEALARARSLQPDVVIMDIDLPKIDGIEVSRRLVDEGSRAAVLVMSVHIEKQYVREAIRAGVKGYVPKHAQFEEVVRAVRAVAAGEVYLSPLVGCSIVELIKEPAEKDPLGDLSEQERAVFDSLVDGLSYKEIAFSLGISVKTVYAYGERIRKKLGLSSSSQIVRFGVHLREGREPES